jgi:ABC-2 type transport system permease protein
MEVNMRIDQKILTYFSFAKSTISQEMTYHVSFITGVIGQWIAYGGTFLSLYIMIENFNVLGGWTSYEVLYLYAFNLLSYALAATVFFTPCRNLPMKIKTGEFDISLTKPIAPFLHEIYNGFNFGYIGHAILSISIMIFALTRLSIQVSIVNLILLLICAALLQAAFLILSSSFCFMTVNQNPVFDFILWNFKSFTNYPITIYGTAIQFFLTFIMPLAFMNFYPSLIILDKAASSPFSSWIPYLSSFVGIAVFILSIKIWNYGLSKYQSSGS